MDMSEVSKFEGRPERTAGGDALRWLAGEIRKPSMIVQSRGYYWHEVSRTACAIGKVWYLNRHRFHDPKDVDVALHALGFNYPDVHSTVIGWNDVGGGLSFDEIADRLDAWALLVDQNGGCYVPPPGVQGIYVTFDAKGKLTVKVTENEGALV